MVDSSIIPVEAMKFIFGEDKTILLTGSKGSGKTNSTSVILETLVSLGFEIWTNIHFFKEENIQIAIQKKKLPYKKGHEYIPKPKEIHMVSKLSSMMLGIINSKKGGKAAIIDEAGIHASSGRATSKSTETIKNLNKIVRHFESSFVLITQTEGSVPPDLREKDVDYRFKMHKFKNKHVLSIGVRKEIVTTWGNEIITFPTKRKFSMPLSKYPCDGKFPTGFTIDIDLKEALDRLSEIEDSVEIMDKGRGENIILEMIGELEEEEQYLTTTEYAKKYKVSKTTVRNWILDNTIEAEQTPAGRYRVLDEPPKK